jgi:hypothetical protein
MDFTKIIVNKRFWRIINCIVHAVNTNLTTGENTKQSYKQLLTYNTYYS